MKMKVAIVYQSPYGQTKKIAQQMKQNIVFESQFNDHVHLIEVDHPKRKSEIRGPIDIFIIGFPVYAGKFPRKLLRWVQNHREELIYKKLAFFTVSLNAADPRPEARRADDELLEKLVEKTGMVPHFIAPLRGALHFTKYGFFKKLLLKWISRAAGGPTDTSKDHELTDWKEVQEFCHAIRTNDLQSRFTFDHQCSPVKKIPKKFTRVANADRII